MTYNGKENGNYRHSIGVIYGYHGGSIGIMEKNMETTNGCKMD